MKYLSRFSASRSGGRALSIALALAAAVSFTTTIPEPARADDAAGQSVLPSSGEKPTWFPVSYRNGVPTRQTIALTFDDGPHPTLTPQLIEILRREDVPATFFLLGVQVERFPGVARQVAEAGFEIANHSYDHKKLTKVDAAELTRQVDHTQDLIRTYTGAEPTLFRAPYGAVNQRVREKCKDGALDIVAWSIDPEDWKSGKTPQGIAEKIVASAQPGGIVVLHDIHARSIQSVPLIIKGLREKGFQFVTAGELIRERKAELAARPDAAQIASGEAPVPPVGGGLVASADIAPPAAPPAIPLTQTSYKDYRARFAGGGG